MLDYSKTIHDCLMRKNIRGPRLLLFRGGVAVGGFLLLAIATWTLPQP
jgi:hypothetical protein